MNDEIREILVLQNYVSRYKSDEKAIINHRLTTALMLDYLEVKNLLDYITNLQEENEVLKKNQRYYKNGVFSLEYDKETLSDMVDDYKSRVEKAVNNCEKSIESINKKLENNKEPFEVVDGKIIYLNDYQVCRLKAIRMKCKELLNILQNGSENND